MSKISTFYRVCLFMLAVTLLFHFIPINDVSAQEVQIIPITPAIPVSPAPQAPAVQTGPMQLPPAATAGQSGQMYQQQQTMPGMMYQQPGQMYQQPGQMYQQPGQMYQQPGQMYQQPGQMYQQPGQMYQQPGQMYQQPGQMYQQPGQMYQQPGQMYQQPGQMYQQPGQMYQQPQMLAPGQLPAAGQTLVPGQMYQPGQMNQPLTPDQTYQPVQMYQPAQKRVLSHSARSGYMPQPAQMLQSGQMYQQPGQMPQSGQMLQSGVMLQPTQMLQPLVPSEFEKYVSGVSTAEISMDISQFGYDFFQSPSTIFTPADKLPVSSEYIIGPGDEIKISIWGKIQTLLDVIVERDGTITLPTIGTIGVSGLSFKELKDVLHREASKYYKGFEMSVSMGSLRTITVYVVGNAARPGTYTISSLSSIINALFEAGGPNKNGTMRDIQLIRKGETIIHLDLYDFLLRGDKTKDVRLLPEDVVFIPTVGRRAAVAGNVTRPAIYELDPSMKLSGLISMAGGVSAMGYMQRIQVETIFQNEVKKLLDSNFKDISGDKDILISDGDIVKVFQISNVLVNSVVLRGNVSRPGSYQWFQGMRVTDVIKNSEKDLMPETYFDHALIERFVPPDFHKEMMSIDLGKALFAKDPVENRLLRPYDLITVYSKWEYQERPRIRITGAVHKPGDFELKRNMRISDLIKLAGGLKYYAFSEKAELTRVKPTAEGPKTEFIPVNLAKALADDEAADIVLYENDFLFVRAVPDWDLYKTVTLGGEVKFPGIYTVKKDDRLSSLLERAGGLTSNAYVRGAMFFRESVRQLQQEQIDEMVDRLQRELLSAGVAGLASSTSSEDATLIRVENEQKRIFLDKLRTIRAKGRITIRLPQDIQTLKGSASDITLNDGDLINIPSNPKTVQVVGSVYNQTAFIYDDSKGVSDYIDLAGGYTDNADSNGTYVLMADGSTAKGSSGFLGFRKSWESAGSGIGAGDTIVVPEKLERVAWMRNVKDITQILSQIAVTAAVVLKMF